MPNFRVKSVKIYTGQKNLHGRRLWRPWQIWGMRQDSGCCKFVNDPCLGQFVDDGHDYALYHPICWISGISRAGERERVAHLPNTQVINPWGDNTRLYIFPKFDYLGQIQVPSQEIWIFSLRNVPACLMNCSQNYILHVCFHLNLKHANTRQLLVNPSFEFLTHRAYSITTRTKNCQCYCSQDGQKGSIGRPYTFIVYLPW